MAVAVARIKALSPELYIAMDDSSVARRLARSARRLLAAVALGLAALPAVAADLTVSAAASLTDAFREIGAAFEAAQPGSKVLLNFAASGALLQQIANGAPVDVFASADEETMDRAEKQGLVAAGARRDFAANALVVVVPAGAAAVPRTLADLRQSAFRRIAVGVPASVPVGRYARAALDKAGLWSDLEPRVVGAQSVRQALDYVARGEADAGFVYATDALLMPGKVAVAFTVPTGTPVRYPVAPLAASRNAEAARRFVDYVLSAPGQAVLAKYGFGRP